MNWFELKTFFFQKVQHVFELIQPTRGWRLEALILKNGSMTSGERMLKLAGVIGSGSSDTQ